MFTSQEQQPKSYDSRSKSLPRPPNHVRDGTSGLRHERNQIGEKQSSTTEESGHFVGNTVSLFADWKSWVLRPSALINFSGFSNVRTSYWKPMTLKAIILGPFILVSISLIIILELLARSAGLTTDIGSSGAVAYADKDGNFSTNVSFTYLYLPTIIAVCYSMVWSWIDLDAKRLEPWFQLSQDNGATADDSLLLQYPFDFVAAVPLRAARRKHWSVFFAGTTMMIIFWVVTPLQSAIFGTGVLPRTITTYMNTDASIAPVESQANILNSGFLMTAYGISWLDQKVPPFTTKSHVVMPFAPVEKAIINSPSEVWSSSAEAYSTNLVCNPANISKSVIDRTYSFDNGRGCFVPDLTLPMVTFGSTHTILYIGYYNDAHVDWALESPNCTLEFAHNFLAIWASADSSTANQEYHEITALFCETSYPLLNVTVQVNASDHSIIMDDFESKNFSQQVGSRTNLIEEIFNITHFEYILGTGFSPQSQATDYPNTIPPEQYPKLSEYNLTWPVNNMVGYAVAAASLPAADLGDPTNLQSAFVRAHQLLFSVAFSQLLNMTDQPLGGSLRDGLLEDQPNGIILVRVFSIVVEIFLALICVMAGAVWYVSLHRKSQLVTDPNSIGQYMSMVSESSALKEVFKGIGTKEEKLKDRLRLKTFRVRGLIDSVPPSMHLEVLKGNPIDVDDSTTAKELPGKSENFVTPYRPIELRISAAIVFIGALSCSVAALVFLNIFISNRNGLELPSPNAALRQILENYVPTIVATVIEPFWGVLNRLLCILKPFDELRKGKAAPSRSIDVRYTSLPPPLVFWRALKARHFLLAAVCGVVVLANVLAVSLSGLLDEAITVNVTETTSSYQLESFFNGNPLANFGPTITYSDHFYVTLANISTGTSLPPWIGRDFFFVPFNIDNSTNSSNAQFGATTRAFGASTTCEVVTPSSRPNRLIFEESENSAQFSIAQEAADGTETICFDTINQVGLDHNETTMLQDPPGNGPNGFNLITSLAPLDDMNATEAGNGSGCNSLITAGWVRLGRAAVEPRNSSTNSILQNRTLDSVFLLCEPILQTALFNVTVDSSGRILDSQQVTSFDTNLQPFFQGRTEYQLSHPGEFMSNTTNALFAQANSLMMVRAKQSSWQWHNSTTAVDWMTYLLSIQSNSSVLLDTTAPAPLPSTIAPALESLHRQLFATLLGLNTNVFGAPSPSASSVTVTVTRPDTRIFMSGPMYQLSLTILIINLVAAILYYTHRPPRFLPAMPTTIASIVGLVVATRALQDYRRHDHNDPPPPSSPLPARDALRYSYGRFLDTDGLPRIGIERHPWVVPLTTVSLNRHSQTRNTTSWWSLSSLSSSSPSSSSSSWLRKRSKTTDTWI